MPALQASSGTQAFNPSLGELVIEAYSRIQVRPPALTADHFFQARLSAGLQQAEWSNRSMPMLSKVELLKIPLLPGQAHYQLPTSVIAPLDGFIRVYQPAQPQNFAISGAFTAAAGSTSMKVTLTNHSLAPDEFIWWPAPVATSGVLIQGPYLVTSIFDSDNFEITLPTPADGTNSAAVAIYTATVNSSLIAVQLPEHGLAGGDLWYDNLGTMIGGMTLSGGMTVTSVIGPNNFVIQAPQTASASGTMAMNGGQAQIQTQAYGVDWQDYILYPVSRTDYATQPDKQLQYRPTTFWINRQRYPEVVFWNEPDNNGPYIFHLWVMQQFDDPQIDSGVGVDVVYRWLDAFAAGLAMRLFRKFPPPATAGITMADLKAEYEAALEVAMREDIERAPFFITPGLSGYYS